MGNLIKRLRVMTETAATDYSVNSVTYWTDDQLQDVLDMYRTEINQRELIGVPEYSGGSTIWKDYPLGAKDLEEATSNSGNVVAWSLVDSTGTEVSSSDYAADYISGIVRFVSDTSGAIYFLKARSYNLSRAAADIWRRKAAHVASGYDFSTEGQSFSRSQLYANYIAIAEQFGSASGLVVTRMVRTDLV
jgi:hypothetical protein